MSHVIPKRKITVTVHLQNGESLPGAVFLDYIDVIHRGEQTLLDKLNDDYVWFALGTREEAHHIVNRDLVAFVEPESGIPDDLVRKDGAPVFRRERITLRLGTGREIEGQIAMDLPDEFSRVSDFLNFPQDFFAVETADGPVLVSKKHVVYLTPHESPPPLPDDFEL